jgi:ribosomal protein S18 acetylase RimI-like enzyme
MEGPRACRREELDALRILENTVFRTNGGSCMFREFPTLFHESNCDRLRVCVEDGRPVSVIAYVSRTVVIFGNTFTVGSLGAVATYEEHRGKGLATALLDDTFEHMKSDGVDVVFISGQRGLYQRAGCAIAGHEMRYSIDGSALAAADNKGISVAEATDDDIPELIALHQMEPARFVRSPWEWQQFLSVFRITPSGATPPYGTRSFWVFRKQNRIVAYGAISIEGEKTNPSAYVQEFAGDRGAVLGGLAALGSELGLKHVRGPYLPEDGELTGLLQSLGVVPQLSSIGGHRMSLLTTDILRRYDPWITERVGGNIVGELGLKQIGDTWFLTNGKTQISIGNLENANSVLWGDAAKDLEASSQDRELWQTLLPLPFLLSGMNYI